MWHFLGNHNPFNFNRLVPYFAFLFLYMSGCKPPNEETNDVLKSYIDTENIDSLKCEPTKIDGTQIGRVMMMQFIGDYLVIGDLPTEYLYKVYDQNLNFMFDLCRKGEGPNEYTFPTFLQPFYKDGRLRVKTFNSSNLRCEELDWTKTIASKKAISILNKPIKANTSSQKMLYLPERGDFLVVGFFQKRYAVVDASGAVKKEFGEYPFRKDFPKVSFQNLAMAYQGEFTINNRNIAFAVINSPNIDFIKYTTDSMIVVKEAHLGKPDFQTSNNPNEYSAAIKAENKIGFIDIQSDENNVYALYSGKDLQNGINKAFESNTIFVFDWAGNIIKKLILDEKVARFCIHKNKICGFVDASKPKIIVSDLPILQRVKAE